MQLLVGNNKQAIRQLGSFFYIQAISTLVGEQQNKQSNISKLKKFVCLENTTQAVGHFAKIISYLLATCGDCYWGRTVPSFFQKLPADWNYVCFFFGTIQDHFLGHIPASN